MVYTYSDLQWFPLTNEKGVAKGWVIHQTVTGDGATFNATFPNTAARGVEVASYLQGHKVRITHIQVTNASTDVWPMWMSWVIYPDSSQNNYLKNGVEIVPYCTPTHSAGVTIPVNIVIPYWGNDRSWAGCLFEMWQRPPTANASVFIVEVFVEVLD